MANTQNFRVKHGLEVQESASFSNTVTIAGNTQLSDKSLIITGGDNLAISAQGRATFGNSVTVSNGSLNVYAFASGSAIEGLRATSANSSASQTLVINTSATTLSGNLFVTGESTIVSGTGNLNSNTSNIVIQSGSSGSPSSNAAFNVRRGSSPEVKILWDEVTDTWKFTNDGSRYYPLKTYTSLVYSFDTSTTTAADPGDGKARFNNSTYSSVTELALDLQDIAGNNITSLLDSLDDSTSTDRAFLTFRSSENQNNFVVYKITANVITSTTGVRRFTVSYVAGGTVAFNANETIFLEYSIVGNVGAQGPQGITGAQGFQGPQGRQGAQGAQGFQGPQGFQGFQGVTGAQGTGYTSLNSSSSVTINTGVRTFIVSANNSTSAMGVGLRVRAAATANVQLYVEGLITSFAANTLVIDAEVVVGTGNTFASWNIFAPGSFGPQGQTGALGPTGPQGPQGIQGAQGAQGNQGFTGSQGAQGNQGPQGITGAQGFQGAQGNQGPQGITGAQGFQGPQGRQGAQGNQGAPSTVEGPQGPQGFTGPQGAQGRQGAQGNQGPQGAQGNQGSASTVPGPQGPQGPQGFQGNTGGLGPTGPQGPQGPQGRQGALGVDGPQGPQGITGAQGPEGAGIITDDITTDATHYPVFANTNSGTLLPLTSSTNLTFNPLTGTLSSTNFNSLSDARFKDNVETIEHALNTLFQLRGVSFTMNGKEDIGVIAQEVYKVLPQLVTETNGVLRVSYDSFIGLLIQAIKELKWEVDSLKK